MHSLMAALADRVLVCDGAMGTAIHAWDLDVDRDYEGLEGCSEILSVTRPDVIEAIHAGFLDAGCDAIETNAFGANALVLAEYDCPERDIELAQAAAELARKVADAYSTPERPRFVFGNLGPTTKLPSLLHVDFDTMADSYRRQTLGLLEGGVDALIIETCQDILQAKCALAGIDDACTEFGSRPPVIVQVTMETTGAMLMGTELPAAFAAIWGYDVQVFGLNCATGPQQMEDHVRWLSANCPLPISIMPNAGLPQMVKGEAHFPLQPHELAEWHARFVTDYGVALVGGCCGTTAEHLRQVVERVGGQPAPQRDVTFEPSLSSLYSRETIEQESSFLIVGERCNTTGSKKFREQLQAGDVDGMVQTARDQVKGGAMVLDVCVDYVGRDGVSDMQQVMSRFATQVTVPIMVDSTEAPVLEAALKLLGGKSAINSINLENGRERPETVLPYARRYNAAVVALTIDEEGMARTAERKVEIAKRLYDISVDEYGLAPSNLLFDVLTLPISTGAADERRNAVETIEGIRGVKAACPGAYCLLGVSNVSFGLNPAARQVLNSVFLHECMEAGLDAAIVHAQRIMPLYKIDEAERDAALDLIYDRQDHGDPLQRFMKLFEDASARVQQGPREDLSLEEDLARRIVDGDSVGMTDALDQALESYAALDIINDFLLAGMGKVGELFGSGQMQLPFVLQSAEVMKQAVAYLEPHMEKAGGAGSKGTLVLATVKGDVHDIGKNLVDIILSNNGYKVVNLGIKQPIGSIVEAALEHQADAIGLSGLLVKSTLVMRDDLVELNHRGLDYFPVILGGAALTRNYVEEDLRELYQGTVLYGQDAFEGLAHMDTVCSPAARHARRERLRRGADAVAVAEPVAEEEAKVNGTVVRSDVPELAAPEPPQLGTEVIESFDLDAIWSYVNPLALYGGQYRLRRRPDESREDWWARVLAEIEPRIVELKERIVAEGWFQPQAITGFFRCAAEGDDLVVETDGGAPLRFTFPRQPEGRHLCLSDFFRSAEQGGDWLAAQLVTLGERVAPIEQELYAADKYTDYLYLHGLAVETTEALAECVHQHIRRAWGIAEADAATPDGLFRQEYRGARYSFGYPACPDLDQHTILFEMLRPERIGVTLSEEYMLVPEVATSALVTAHPEARYFGVAAEGTPSR